MKDGNDLEVIFKVIEEVKVEIDKLMLIEVKIVIGYGVFKEGIFVVYGVFFGEDGIKMVKEVYGWDYLDFIVFEEVVVCFY